MNRGLLKLLSYGSIPFFLTPIAKVFCQPGTVKVAVLAYFNYY